jgi:hypothetical protein
VSYFVSALDLGVSFLLLGAVALLSQRARTAAFETDCGTVSAADYSVLVSGLPRDASVADVLAHFNRYGLPTAADPHRKRLRYMHLLGCIGGAGHPSAAQRKLDFVRRWGGLELHCSTLTH